MWGIAAVVSAPGIAVATLSSSTSGFDWQNFVSAGVTPAAVLALLIFRKLFTAGEALGYKARAEHAETQLELLHATMSKDVVPALTLSTQVLDRLAPSIEAELADRLTRRRGAARRQRDQDE